MSLPRGWLIVYTGDGKGKTTAALGLVFRALGRRLEVAVVQFIKGRWETGERRFARGLEGLTFEVAGEGFTWESDDLARDREAARAGWRRACALIDGGGHAIVVLDELTFAISHGFLALGEVLDALARRGAVHVVVTGRHAAPELIEAADLVTECRALKHPFHNGERARAGIDY